MILSQNRSTQALLTVAAVVIILGGINLSSEVFSPILLAYFLSMLLNPAVRGLERLYIPRGLGIIILISLFIMACAALIGILGHTLQEFSRAIPGYRQELMELITRLEASFSKRNISVDFSSLLGTLDSRSLFNVATKLVTKMSSATSYFLLTILTVVFMLLEVPLIHNKLRTALPNPERQLQDVERFIHSVNRYLALKTVLSAVTGLLVALLLKLHGIEFHVLGGLLAFFLNFIPNIGSVLAAIPGVLITLLQKDLGDATTVAAGYIAINMLIGNIIEPKVLGRGLGLSTLTVFLSLLLWGWLLGPIGMLLSVPLTMCFKILLESTNHHGLAFLLGPGVDSENTDNKQP